MAMRLAVAVFLFFLLFFLKTRKHRNDMRPSCMSKGSQIKVDDDKSTKEYPEKHMKYIYYLYPANEVYDRRKKFGVPEEKAGNELQRDKQHHDHEIRDLLHRIELMVWCGMVGIMRSNHDATPIKFSLHDTFFGKLHRMV